MTKSVLIIGGYGNFGRSIAEMLAEDDVRLILAGRNAARAERAAQSLKARHAPLAASIDIEHGLERGLDDLSPDMVIHTSGPFQDQGYHVAEACLRQGRHYIDLADARAFVAGITVLDARAKERGVLICSGASSVPCLTAAITDRYMTEFQVLEALEYAIATAQLTNRGLATIRAVLSYAGKPFTTLIDGEMRPVYGWLGLTWRRFWGLNMRALCDADIPDLALFPARYPTLRNLRFRAGLELKLLHLTLTALAWLVRRKALPSLQPLAPLLRRLSFLFDPFGKDDSGFYMLLTGKDACGSERSVRFNLTARRGDGLRIPCVPAVILARRLARGELTHTGATPCLGIITLDEYLEVLNTFNILHRVALSPEP